MRTNVLGAAILACAAWAPADARNAAPAKNKDPLQTGSTGSYMQEHMANEHHIGAFDLDEAKESPNERAYNFFNSNISLVVILFFFLCYKLIKRTRIVRLMDMDIHTGRRDPVSVEVLEQERAEARARPFWKRMISTVF